MSVETDLIAAMKAYADATGDDYFRAAWGATGAKIEIDNISEDTGQVWLYDPNMAEAMFSAIASVLGGWVAQDYTAVVAPNITLPSTPTTAAALMVFHSGVLLQQVSGTPSGAMEYSWSGTVITFGAPLTGWIHARYIAAR